MPVDCNKIIKTNIFLNQLNNHSVKINFNNQLIIFNNRNTHKLFFIEKSIPKIMKNGAKIKK